MSNLTVSCVVPTLNSASTIDYTLCSLLTQRNVKVEVIVVDSGSTDGTLGICARWNVKCLYAEPGNMYRAINLGLQQCNSDWLAYLNSDDWWYQDTLFRLINRGNALNANVVYGNCDYVDSSGRFIFSMAAADFHSLHSLFKMSIFGFAQQAAIFRRDTYQQLNGFNEEYRFSADADFYLRAIQAGLKFALLPGASVACFRLHENQLTQKKAKEMEQEKQKIYAPLGKPSIIDKLVFIQWRIRNSLHYLLRLLRQSLLANKLRFSNSINVDIFTLNNN